MTEIGNNNPGHTIASPGQQNHALTLAWAAGTHTGYRRVTNEDSFVASFPLFAVADGMGGHSAGDLASAAVVSRLAEVSSGDFLPVSSIENALRKATSDISLVAQDSVLGVGTTVTGLALTEHNKSLHFSVFNIGDSRVYKFEGDHFLQITRDHSVVQNLVDAGVITREEAEYHPDANIITRAVGFDAAPEPDITMLPILSGQRLLICSDGLTREVPEKIIAELFSRRNSPDETVSTLIELALDGGGRDNITAIVIDVVDAPAAS